MTTYFRHTAAALVLAASAILPSVAGAQLPIPSLSVVGGVSQYKLSSSGSTPFGALRLDIPLIFAVAEGSLGIMRPDEASGAHTYIVPEAQLQWQLFPLLVKPYVGVGGGWFRAISGPGTHTSELTGSASLGVRVGVPLIGAGFRAEVRTRGIGGFDRRSTEWTAGLGF